MSITTGRGVPRGLDPSLTAEFRIPRLRQPTGAPEADTAARPAYAPIPMPPTDAEKHWYVRRGLGVLMSCSLLSFSCLVVSQWLLLRLSPWLWLLMPFLGFTIVYYLVSLVVNIGTRGFNLRQHRALVRDWRPQRYPSVDVFLPVCGESPHVLTNTWQYVRRMAQHYPGPIKVHVLDDSPDETLRRVAESFGFGYLRRPNRGWFKKAGNLRYGYANTDGQFILILDADFTPRHDMITEMLPYFDAEPDLGIVQSPQYFRVHKGQGWLERGAGAVQELFYRSVQVSRQQHGAAICVGSCAIYRRAALDAIGGTALIEHSEDVHTGFDLRLAGWRLRYLPLPLATGLCPADVPSFFTQQYRWCAGSLSLLGSTKFRTAKLRLRARLSYVSGFCYYLHTAVFTLVTPVLPIVLLWQFPHAILLSNYLLLAPSIAYTFVIFPMWHRASYGLSSFTVKLIYGWAHLFAATDTLRGRRMGWQPTGGGGRKAGTRRLQWGLWVWTVPAGLAWTALAAMRILDGRPLDFVPIFLAGVVYLTVAAQALLVRPERDIKVIA